MYEVGKVYIWQNQTGEYAFLNGAETIVTRGATPSYRDATNQIELCWETDSQLPHRNMQFYVMVAFAGDLRPKNPPKGEQQIMDLFKITELETV